MPGEMMTPIPGTLSARCSAGHPRRNPSRPSVCEPALSSDSKEGREAGVEGMSVVGSTGPASRMRDGRK